ncbi:alpha/beta hydrolase [Secundilactobacillus pentosiphilus]|uniref:Alpha/beta hydrolase n=1 Tax=Secundilactobacillus pentosiphilus TaxID=1714682 RepID=A0A1Z5IX83_9LACO|nr:alpha/beta hydrolase [Secundilactobacillus pentosiphilus]GAX06375.1 alpha/beta hydrolase [Secundilactobacillus pentosiphilus]
MKKRLTIAAKRPAIWQDTNIIYARVPDQGGHTTLPLHLSVLRPFESQSQPLPVIFWFCGGGWITVDYNGRLPNLVDFVRAGYAVVSVEYRNSDQAHWPAQLEDAKAAIRYIKAHAARYGIDPHRVAVMGESAGGHLASMVALTNGMKTYETGQYLYQNSDVKVAIPWCGIVSPLTAKQRSNTDDLDYIYGKLLNGEPETHPDLVAQANPRCFIKGQDVSFLLLHGTADDVAPLQDDEEFYDDLVAHQMTADLYELAGAGHLDDAFLQPEVIKIMLRFLKDHLD